MNLQRLAVVALALADVALDLDVRQEVHLDLDDAVTLAGLAAPALDVEGEPPGLVAALVGLGQPGEPVADRRERAGVGGGVGARRAADRRLVDVDDLVEELQPLDAVVIAGMLAKQRELMKFYWSDQTQIEQAIAAGEVVAAYCWSGSVAQLKKQGVPIAYMVPKEGLIGYSCGLVRHAKAPGDEQAAYDFLNAMLDPESGKWLIESAGYFHSNRRTYKIVDPKVLSDMGASDPEATFAALSIDPEPDEPYRSKYIELVNNVKAGL